MHIIDPTTNVKVRIEDNGGMAVNIQDPITHALGAKLYQVVGAVQTLASTTVIGAYTITLEPGHAFIAGDRIAIIEADEFYTGNVVSVATNTLTLTVPIHKAFTTAATVIETTTSLNVDGSTTPQEFSLGPLVSAVSPIDVYGVRFQMVDSTAMDDSTFGGLAAIARGIVFQWIDGTDIHNVWHARTNGELSLSLGEVRYAAKPPSGKYGLLADWKVREQRGVAIRLEPGDQIKIIVQDDLTGLDAFEAYAYGHRVND